MEDYLNREEARLFDLIESKNWEDLTPEERSFAETQISQEEYVFQRRILAESEDLYPAETEPLPLAIPVVTSTLVARETIPLYQAVIAVAATVLIFLMIWPGEVKTEVAIKQPVSEVIQTDPVVEKQYVTDTIIRYVTLPASNAQIIVDTIREFITATKLYEEPKLLEVASNLIIPELSKESLSTKGASLKEENTSQLLPKMINTIY